MHRRQFLAGLTAAAALPIAAAESDRDVIETHVHLFSGDFERFPSHPNAWKPQPAPLERYLEFARKVGIRHAVHVSAEPYQDDHRYVIHTVQNAPAGFLKGTLLLDTTKADTTDRLASYVKEHPGKLVALRVHCTRGQGSKPVTEGPIRDRDLDHPNVAKACARAGELGVAMQAHIQPWFAGRIYELAEQHPQTRFLIDHFGHAGVGAAVRENGAWRLSNGELGYKDPAEFDQIVRLAKLPNVHLKVSSLQYSSRQPHPHADIRPLAQKAFDAFGPDRMMWGSLGNTEAAFKQKSEVFDSNFEFLSSADRRKIRYSTAQKFFGFSNA